MRAEEAQPAHRHGRSLSPVLRARQGARGSRRVRRVVPLLRARQRAEAGREPLPARDHRAQHAPADRRSARASSSRARRAVAATARDPIFIVGLPRSGSTLLEQILASHSQVEGTMELADIQRIVHELAGPRAGSTTSRAIRRCWRELSAEDFRSLGERYLADTRVYRTGKPFFIDKMPNNFRHIGLIHLMLPNAKIIDARREPMACCFSNLKQLFANGQEFTYSLEDIARYYRTYLELMRHWDAVLPGQGPAGAARGRGRGSRRQRAPHARFLRPRRSSRPASSSTRPSAACAPRAPSRCASRSSARGSTSGATSSRGSGR